MSETKVEWGHRLAEGGEVLMASEDMARRMFGSWSCRIRGCVVVRRTITISDWEEAPR